MGERVKENLDDQRDALAQEVMAALNGFMSVDANRKRAAGLREVCERIFETQPDGDELISAEAILAEIDPQQLIEAQELENILTKLHGCVIRYRLWRREGVEYEARVLEDGSLVSEEVIIVENADPYTMEVRSHSITLLPEWQKWMVCLNLAPVIRENGEQFTLPLNEFYDLEVLALKSEL